MEKRQTLEAVRDYYGKVLQSTKDLMTSACCTAESLPEELRSTLALIHPEVKDRFYGCGSPVPCELNGKTVLDLGCGTGRDCYLLSPLVGATGKVIGVDMTEGQLEVARKHVQYHMDRFGFKQPNVDFRQGFIEDLESAGIATNSIDVIISNCVVNLSPDKHRVFSEIFRVLKNGGELYFSDIFSDRRIPSHLTSDPVLLGECLAGALYFEDFRRTLASIGVLDYRFTSKTPITLNNPDVAKKIGMVNFYSATIRAFKLDDLEDRCEDFGQVAYYLGTVPGKPHQFVLDDHHTFKTGAPLLVCSNTASMLANSRYGKHFRITGDTKTHLGLFDCAPTPATSNASNVGACC